MARGRQQDQSSTSSAQPDKSVRVCVIDRNCLDDLKWWARENPKICEKALSLIEQVLSDPFDGLGKPELLKNLGPNTWSRRLTGEHRLVYVAFDGQVNFVMARYHY